MINLEPVAQLVAWVINDYGHIQSHLKRGWLQLEDYNVFKKQIHQIHGQHGHIGRNIEVQFNHWIDKKVHFRIKPDGELNIITFEKFSKCVWNYLKNQKSDYDNYEQLSLF